MNRFYKGDAACFIIGEEIRNVQTHKKQTVTDISTPCLSACVDNNVVRYFMR